MFAERFSFPNNLTQCLKLHQMVIFFNANLEVVLFRYKHLELFELLYWCFLIRQLLCDKGCTLCCYINCYLVYVWTLPHWLISGSVLL